jgi:hypothetical protein
MKLKIWIFIGLIITGLMIYLFAFTMQPSALEPTETMSFSTDSFIDASTLSNTNRLVSSNQNFELYINETNSHFHVTDKRNGEIWRSNPVVADPWQTDPNQSITNTALEKQKATLELSYFNEAGSLATITNYRYSIYHPQSILNAEGLRTFKIKYLPNAVQVLYQLEDLEIDYLFFPKFLPKDVMEALPDAQLLQSIAYTGFNEEFQAYEIIRYVEMSRLVKQRLYNVFYLGDMDYSRERAIEENANFGYTDTFEKISFQIGVEIRLHDFGITTSIIHDSIVEPDNVKLANISLFPMFGTAISIDEDNPTEGYIVLPDGSGAVMEFNNGKHYQVPYRKRLYGRDISMLRYKMAETQEKISIPLYGMVKPNAGYAAIITDGDAMASINADVSQRIDSYNKAFTSFEFREFESITLGSGFNVYGVDVWTKDRVKSDFTVRYTFLNGADANYVGIANVYRNYLVDEIGLIPKTQTPHTIVTTEFLGAYDKQSFILGVPYSQQRALTTFDQAEHIIDELNDRNISNINILYTGIINGGINHSINDSFDVERVLGGKRGFNDFVSNMSEIDIEVYPLVTLMTASNYHRQFDRFRYTANRISGSNALMFNYHLPSRLPYSETAYEHSPDDYIINPQYYEAIYNKLDRKYPINQIAFSMMGSTIAGHYDYNNTIYRQDATMYQQQLMQMVNQKMMLSRPLAYAFAYADYVTDLPTQTTLYAIIDYQIPLLQLVLSGLLDYSTHSINMANTRSLDYNFLKAIETGSNLKYTLTYRDSKDLLQTEYNFYMSTHYVNWLDIIESQVKTLDALGIHQGRLIGHERLRNNVYKVTYSHGLEIIINYNLSPVTIEGQWIPSLDYLVLEV